MSSVQEYAAPQLGWRAGGPEGGYAESGRRKALRTTFPGCRSGRLDFLHRDHRVALSGGNPRQTRGEGERWGDRKTGPGKKEREGKARCWPHSMRESLLKAPYTSPPFLYCHGPLLPLPHLPLQKRLIFSQSQNTKPQHLSSNNRALLFLPVPRIKC